MSLVTNTAEAQHRDRDRYSDTRYGDACRPAWFGLAVIAAFVAILLLWGWLAPVSGAVIADGSLQVESQRQAMQHPYGGVVTSLKVREGQHVEKGDLLIELSDTEPRSRVDVLLSERDALSAQEARLIAERDQHSEIAFGDDLARRAKTPAVRQTMANERAVLAARSRQFEAETDMLRKQANRRREEIAGTRAQIVAIERQRELIEEEAKGARELLEKGFTPKPRVLALERTIAQLDGDRSARRAEVAGAEQSIAESELALARAERERITEITDLLRTTQSRLAELRPKVDAAQDVLDRTRVRAPATGSVVGLVVFTEGGVVQPGAKLLDVVPDDNPLIVDARLKLHDVNEVKPGQGADIRLTGVTRSERPTIRGTVMTVSADRMTDRQTGAGYYTVRVRPDPADLRAVTIALQSGMPAEVVVTTRPRTFATYLLGPLLDEMTGGFRER